MLMSRPAGISWTVIPTLNADTQAQQAQLALVCQNATSAVDRYCRQPLRATVVTDQDNGPGQPRVGVDRHTRRGTLITRQSPVTAVNAVQVSQARTYPPQWMPVPAGLYGPRRPVLRPASGVPVTGPSGGNMIDVAPGYITWDQGRGGWDVLYSYTSGWPHAGITGAAAADAAELTVDDVTGWAGWSGFVIDGQLTEVVDVTAVTAAVPVQLPGNGGTVQAGPGTLALAEPLQYAHQAGAVVTALPMDVLHAAALAAMVEALEGIDAIATQSLSGQMAGGTGVLAEEYELKLDDFRRVM